MAYGRHWEWRGFGTIPPTIERRVVALPSAGVPERTVTDYYLHAGGTAVNVKIRAWPGGGSLKVKRLLSAGDPEGPSLWEEDPEEDHAFPVAGPVLTRCLEAIGIAPPSSATAAVGDAAGLLAMLTRLGEPLRMVEVRKRRRTFVWSGGAAPVLVELADIATPERTASLGLEDMAGLSAHSAAAEVAIARRAVIDAACRFGESLRRLTYPQAVATWAGGGSVTDSGAG
jgi:hypothetical protein